MRFVLGDGKDHLVRIPPGVAHGAGNIGQQTGRIIYMVDVQFSGTPGECDEGRLPWDFLGQRSGKSSRGEPGRPEGEPRAAAGSRPGRSQQRRQHACRTIEGAPHGIGRQIGGGSRRGGVRSSRTSPASARASIAITAISKFRCALRRSMLALPTSTFFASVTSSLAWLSPLILVQLDANLEHRPIVVPLRVVEHRRLDLRAVGVDAHGDAARGGHLQREQQRRGQHQVGRLQVDRGRCVADRLDHREPQIRFLAVGPAARPRRPRRRPRWTPGPMRAAGRRAPARWPCTSPRRTRPACVRPPARATRASRRASGGNGRGGR